MGKHLAQDLNFPGLRIRAASVMNSLAGMRRESDLERKGRAFAFSSPSGDPGEA